MSNEMDQTRALFKDVLHVLDYLMLQIQPTDSVRGAMSRLREAIKTDEDKTTLQLNSLKERRSALVQQTFEIAHQRERAAYAASQAADDATAKQRAAQATARYEAHREEIGAGRK
jgi:hypothetical protein